MSNPYADWLRQHGTKHFNLGTKAGWIDFVNTGIRPDFRTLTIDEMRGLDPETLEDYNQARNVWNSNPATVKTPQLKNAHDLIDQVMASSHRDGSSVRGAVALDALPGLGKTTIASSYARHFDQQQRRRYGHTTADGNPRLPVAFIPLSAGMTLKQLNQKILRFYDHPAATRTSKAELGTLAMDCIHSTETRLIVLDDLHFINFNHRTGVEVSNHLKWLANESAATFIHVGVGLSRKKFFDEGLGGDPSLSQTSRRTTSCPVAPFTLSTESGKRAWQRLLSSFESHLKLANNTEGTLTGLGDYLFERTQGHIASVTNLMDRACAAAITTGTETITYDIVKKVVIDNAAETASSRR